MRPTGKKDLRVTKTIKAIKEAFVSLVTTTDYAHINVNQLCQRAHINRKTFYRYYETLDDLLAEVQSEHIEAFLK